MLLAKGESEVNLQMTGRVLKDGASVACPPNEGESHGPSTWFILLHLLHSTYIKMLFVLSKHVPHRHGTKVPTDLNLLPAYATSRESQIPMVKRINKIAITAGNKHHSIHTIQQPWSPLPTAKIRRKLRNLWEEQ